MKIIEFFSGKTDLTCWEIFSQKNKIDDYIEEKSENSHEDATKALQVALNRLPIGEYRVKMMRHDKDHARAINHVYNNTHIQQITTNNVSEMDLQQVYDKALKDAKHQLIVEQMAEDIKAIHKKIDAIHDILSKAANVDDSADHAKTLDKINGFMDLADTFKSKFSTTKTA